METYLEVVKGSGPGRLGKLHIGGYVIHTPNFLHFTDYPGRHDIYLTGAESRTRKRPVIYDHPFFSLEKIRLPREPFPEIVPDFPAGFYVPRGLAEEAAEECLRVAQGHPEKGAVVTATRYPDLAEGLVKRLGERPILAIAGGSKLASNPRLLVEVVSMVRDSSSPNTALYYPLAPVEMFPLLSYLGVDLFDSSPAYLASTEGRYLTDSGSLELRRMTELPCGCSVCMRASPTDLRGSHGHKALLRHNIGIVRKAIIQIREALRGDRLREYVEEKASINPRAMAALRIVSTDKCEFLESYTPICSPTPQRYVSQESYTRPEVKRWHRRLGIRYLPPDNVKLSIILPCSAKKPYSKSRSHRLFRRYIRRGAGDKISLVHEVVLTSPLGLVPRELEGVFPAGSYDIPITGHWSHEEKTTCLELLRDYLKKAGTCAFAHVDGVYREICSRAGAELGTEDILSRESLEHLQDRVAEILEGYEPVPQENGCLEVRGVCDYQFGRGAWKHLMPSGTKRRGRALYYDGAQVAAINPATGLLALTLRGGEMLRDYNRYQVVASVKPPTGNLFCVGVEDAGEEVRPGDEVVVLYGGEVAGVGRAVLSGREMREATHGLAVKLRHRR